MCGVGVAVLEWVYSFVCWSAPRRKIATLFSVTPVGDFFLDLLIVYASILDSLDRRTLSIVTMNRLLAEEGETLLRRGRGGCDGLAAVGEAGAE